MLAARNLVGNAMTGELRPEFNEGKFDRYWALCEKHGLPLFCSTHGSASLMSKVAERHPGLTIIIDHFGVSQSPVSPARAEKWDRLPGVLGLAKYPNVHVKWCGAPLMSDEDYPYNDIWPYLDQILNAFGPKRCLWASDYTRMRWVPQTMNDHKPRNEWKPYSDCLNYLRDTTRLSQGDKEWLLGKTVRTILNWPK
jgi:predicted TIM-barrel fold metal-dependent hydrolase